MHIATQTDVYHMRAGMLQPELLLSTTEAIQAIAGTGSCFAVAISTNDIRFWRNGCEGETIHVDTTARICSLLMEASVSPVLLMGTEPAHIYRVAAPTEPARRIASFDQLACREDWSTPWGGPPAVRSLAWGDGKAVYADIHVGSIMRSFDGGMTWEPVNPVLHRDVHQVSTTPAAPDHVYANTADAVWISPDRGDSWVRRPFPGTATYGRAIAVHPADPDYVLASVSNGPHGKDVRARLLRSDDAGCNWTHVTAGFPDYAHDNIDTGRVVFDADGTAWAAVGSTLFSSDDRGVSWQVAWDAPNDIAMLTG